MNYTLLANIIVFTHVVWVAVVLFSVPLIGLGAIFDWKWVRNRWFRHIHLLMILIVAFEAWIGAVCPLTEWENAARSLGGGEGYDRSFIGELLHNLIYYDFEPWVFTVSYTLFLLVVIILYFTVQPRPKVKKRP